MTLADIAALGNLVSGIAVVGSLIFVGLQTRQNAHAVRSSTAQAIHDNYANWYLSMAENTSALATSLKGFVDYDGLSSVEKAQFISTFMAFTSHSQNAFYQWRDGDLPQRLWIGWEALMGNIFLTSGGQAFWKERSFVFGEDFQAHVKLLMSRRPNPMAKAFGVVPLLNPT